MTKITIRKAEGTWVVRAGGAVLGESQNALELSAGDDTQEIYFPREDIAMAFLDESDKQAEDAAKGIANYFSIVTKSTTLENAAWSYDAPHADAERIKGHLAFDTSDKLAVERI
jgi:uncharacterized protein (DUF427 family)